MSEKWMFMSCGFRADPVLMIRGNGNAVAVIHKGDGFPKSMDRQREEAALIAAAPELLEALETMLLAVEVDKVEGIGHATAKAKAVIAKAKAGGFVHTPSGLLDAAKKVLSMSHAAQQEVPVMVALAGKPFCNGYIEGVGQAADLLRPHIAEAEGDGNG